jgi:uncharacterized protein (TIGR00730 family)
MKKICVYCGASNIVAPHFLEEAENIGKLIANNNFHMVYGGSKYGMMGTLANGALNSGGKVTGVFPENVFTTTEVLNDSLSEIIMVPDMHVRKMTMYILSDAFVILPGGFGTMDETFEMITWKALGMHDKPIIIYNYKNYYNHLLQIIDQFYDMGFAGSKMKGIYDIADDKESILSILKKHL